MRVLLSILLALITVFGLTNNEGHYNVKFERGNNLYTEGKFQEAKEQYVEIVSSGIVSSELYYNLGNCYFKLKEYPKAILYYERSLKLDPTNNDARFNLKIANQQITDNIDVIPPIFYKRWWRNLSMLFSADNWAYLSIAMSILVAICILLFYFSKNLAWKKVLLYLGCFSFVLFCFCLLFGNYNKNEQFSQSSGIVFTPSVTIKSAPSVNSTDIFVIHEGTKVLILEEVNSWVKISLTDGNIGWLKKSHIEII